MSHVFLQPGHSPQRPDWLAEDAVSCEPVSARNSLLTGKFTGNFAGIGLAACDFRVSLQPIQWFPVEFPIQRNREFSDAYQGKSFEEQRICNPDILIFTPNYRFARERISARWSTDQVPDQKNLFLGLGNSRLSRSVLPWYSRRKIPRRCNSGTTRSTKSSSPPGRYGNCIVKPSEPSVLSHSSISPAIVAGVPTIASPEWPPRRCASCRTVRFSRFARSIARCCPLFEALLSGMSGSGPSGSNFDASWPSAIDSEPMAFE